LDKQDYSNLPEEIKAWTCEFCGFHNIINLDEEELPRTDPVDYVISPAPAGGLEEQNVVFCIDISGSMCVTTEVTSSVALKGGADSREASLRAHAEGDQRLPHEKRGVKYVSRLQCVQAAIEQHITQIAKTKPNFKVGLVTFSDEVTIVGDGTQDPLVVAGDKLDSFQDLKQLGESYSITKSVKEAEKDLVKKLWSLQENGCTALGPALMLSILIAGARPASKVILCTDGLANFGLGSMDSGKGSEFTPFYTELAEAAKVKGVSVSIISIEGEDCSMENLSVVTEQTGGEVERVDPRNIANNFQSILTNPVIATACMATIFLHRGLMFKGERDDEGDEDTNLLVKDLGNITAESECTFSYSFRPKSQVDLADVTQVPFQVQLVLTKLNGMRCVRVATASIKVTEDRTEAEQQADLNVIGTYAAQRAAKYAKDGEYERAQMEARAAKRFIHRNHFDESRSDEVSAWSSNVEAMDQQLRYERKQEKSMGVERNKVERKQALKSRDEAAVAISKSKQTNARKLGLL
jgi:hypothetical protein